MSSENNAENIEYQSANEIISPTNINKRVTHWEDNIIKWVNSYGMYWVTSHIIGIIMLIFVYTANPPKDSKVETCLNNNTIYYCPETFTKLYNTYKKFIYLIISIIATVGLPHITRICLNFSKYVTTMARAQGLNSLKGGISTFLGFIIIIFTGVRLWTCYGNADDDIWKNFFMCANSVQEIMRNTNNFLIQMAISCVMILISMLVIFILNIKEYNEFKVTVNEKWNTYTSKEYWYEIKKIIKNSFDPPTYDESVIANSIDSC